MAFDPELEAFKAIDLRALAAAYGYELDRRASWAGSAVLRNHTTDDKVIISRDVDGHYVYFSVRDDRDHGTAINFIQKRFNFTLGDVRRELRPWLGAPPRPLPQFSEPLATTTKDRRKVQLALARTSVATRHPYLENARGIPAGLLASPRAIGCVRIDRRGNAIFPHSDDEGVCGYEIKNRGFTGFAPGGNKGLWLSNPLPGETQVVFCESALDALSWIALFPAAPARVSSIGGRASAAQGELIRKLCASLPAGATIIAAMDADPDGRQLAEIIKKAVDLTRREDLHFEVQEPTVGKDWNEQLNAARGVIAQKRPGEPSVV